MKNQNKILERDAAILDPKKVKKGTERFSVTGMSQPLFHSFFGGKKKKKIEKNKAPKNACWESVFLKSYFIYLFIRLVSSSMAELSLDFEEELVDRKNLLQDK